MTLDENGLSPEVLKRIPQRLSLGGEQVPGWYRTAMWVFGTIGVGLCMGGLFFMEFPGSLVFGMLVGTGLILHILWIVGHNLLVPLLYIKGLIASIEYDPAEKRILLHDPEGKGGLFFVSPPITLYLGSLDSIEVAKESGGWELVLFTRRKERIVISASRRASLVEVLELGHRLMAMTGVPFKGEHPDG